MVLYRGRRKGGFTALSFGSEPAAALLLRTAIEEVETLSGTVPATIVRRVAHAAR